MKTRQILHLLLDAEWSRHEAGNLSEVRHASGVWFFSGLRGARFRDLGQSVVYDPPIVASFLTCPLAAWRDWRTGGSAWPFILTVALNAAIAGSSIALIIIVIGTLLGE